MERQPKHECTVIVLPDSPDMDYWDELEIAERRVEYLRRKLGLLGIERGLEG